MVLWGNATGIGVLIPPGEAGQATVVVTSGGQQSNPCTCFNYVDYPVFGPGEPCTCSTSIGLTATPFFPSLTPTPVPTTTPITTNLNGVCCEAAGPNTFVSVVVGDNGTVIKRTEVQNPYSVTEQVIPVVIGGVTIRNNFNAIFCCSVNEWWIVGDNGTVVVTKDGGQTWTQIDLTPFTPVAQQGLVPFAHLTDVEADISCTHILITGRRGEYWNLISDGTQAGTSGSGGGFTSIFLLGTVGQCAPAVAPNPADFVGPPGSPLRFDKSYEFTSAGEQWIVGSDVNGNGFILHQSPGTNYFCRDLLPSLGPGVTITEITSIVEVAQNEIWAVGRRSCGPGVTPCPNVILLSQDDGRTWLPQLETIQGLPNGADMSDINIIINTVNITTYSGQLITFTFNGSAISTPGVNDIGGTLTAVCACVVCGLDGIYHEISDCSPFAIGSTPTRTPTSTPTNTPTSTPTCVFGCFAVSGDGQDVITADTFNPAMVGQHAILVNPFPWPPSCSGVQWISDNLNGYTAPQTQNPVTIIFEKPVTMTQTCIQNAIFHVNFGSDDNAAFYLVNSTHPTGVEIATCPPPGGPGACQVCRSVAFPGSDFVMGVNTLRVVLVNTLSSNDGLPPGIYGFTGVNYEICMDPPTAPPIPPASPAGTIRLSLSPNLMEVCPGQAIGITVTALNDDNRPARNYRSTIRFGSSDPQAYLPAQYTFTGLDQGIHVFNTAPDQITQLGTVGVQTVSAQDIFFPSIKGRTFIRVRDCPSSPSPTQTSTPTNTLTLTPTRTPTVLPTVTPTNTMTLTPTITPSNTATIVPTITPTNTATWTPTISPTPSPAYTVCADLSGNTCTFTFTPTVTFTPCRASWTQLTTAAQWPNRSAFGALEMTDPTDRVEKIWVLGYNNYVTPNSMDCWASTDGVSWALKAYIPVTVMTPRGNFSTVEMPDPRNAYRPTLWYIGGLAGTSAFGDVWASTDGVTWTEKTSSLGVGVYYHTSVVMRDPSDRTMKMWVLGGSIITVIQGLVYQLPNTQVWCSPDGLNWTAKTNYINLFPSRNNHSSAVMRDPADGRIKMWVIGGQGAAGPLNDVWCSADGVTWTEKSAAAEFPSRFGQSSVACGGNLWVIAGQDPPPTDPYLNDVWASPDGIKWNQVLPSGNIFADRSGLASMVFRGDIFVMGGSPTAGEAYNTNDVWDTGCLNCPGSTGGTASAAEIREVTVVSPTYTPTVSLTAGTTLLVYSVVPAPNISLNGQEVHLRLTLGRPAAVHLAVFALTGEKIFQESIEGKSGLNDLVWGVKNQDGRAVASGLYIYSLQVDDGNGSERRTGKIAVIR